MILSALAYAGLCYTIWSAYALCKHYYQARCLNVPILISPVGTTNIIWVLTQEIIADYIARLPFGLGSWVRYNRRSWIWQFSDRNKIHQEYGPIIAHVAPSEIQIWIADKDVSTEILKGKSRMLFDKPRGDIQKIDFLAPHLMTACGETWKRHRHIVATPFNQQIVRIVWKESLHQGLMLGDHWFNVSDSGVRTVWADGETVAMNVMVTAGFGLPRSSHKGLASETHNSLDFHSSLIFMITQFIWMILIPSRFWFTEFVPPFPASLRMFFESVRAFKKHLEVMVSDARVTVNGSRPQTPIDQTPPAGGLTSDNLLTALVRHSEELKKADQMAGKKVTTAQRNSLSDDEVYSNLFGLAFAGHETTAHALSYTFFLLAAFPRIQDWVIEEIQIVFQDCRSIESLEMNEIYPQLKRTRALMYETLRLFTPLANIFKRTLPPNGASIQLGSRLLHFPPNAYVLPSLHALHSAE